MIESIFLNAKFSEIVELPGNFEETMRKNLTT